MKSLVPFLTFFLLAATAQAQLISRFTWESNPPTTAVSGASGISISSYATVSTGGTHGTKGLNPGTGSNDINLVLDGANFNVPALDISVDFRREESQASFFYRGSYFNFGMSGGSLAANFYIKNGASYTNISSGNVYSIPDDHSFHNYHFNYDNNTGVAKIWVDAVLVYTYTGLAGVPLYWTGAGNVTIGKDMDATGRNIAILDNLVIQIQPSSILPLKLLSFDAAAKNNYAAIDWNTTEEINVSTFVVERSSDAVSFSPFKTVNASNGYSASNHYQVIDSVPFSTVSYYRLKMINDNGSFTYSAIKSISWTNTASAEITAFPNPAVDRITIKMNNAKAGQYHCSILSVTGMVAVSTDINLANGFNQFTIDLTKTTLKGILIIRLQTAKNNTAETFTIVKK